MTKQGLHYGDVCVFVATMGDLMARPVKGTDDRGIMVRLDATWRPLVTPGRDVATLPTSHAGCRLTVEDSLDPDAETFVWCNDHDVTVYWVDSAMAPEG